MRTEPLIERHDHRRRSACSSKTRCSRHGNYQSHGHLADYDLHAADGARRDGADGSAGPGAGDAAARAPAISRPRARRDVRLAAARHAPRRDRAHPSVALFPAPVHSEEALLGGVGVDIVFTWRAVVLAMTVIGLPTPCARAGPLRAGGPALRGDRGHARRSRLRVFFSITLPLAFPALAAGAVLGFTRAIGEFRRNNHDRWRRSGVARTCQSPSTRHGDRPRS